MSEEEQLECQQSTIAPLKYDSDRITDLEIKLEQLDTNLEDLESQMGSVRKTRDELYATIKKLQQNLEICGGKCEGETGEALKLQAVSSEIKKREEMVRELEKKELLLSHSMLAVISHWADQVERTLGPVPGTIQLTEIYSCDQSQGYVQVQKVIGTEEGCAPPPQND